MVAGVMIAGINQFAKLGNKPLLPLDPPAPNMEEINYELATVFRTFMGAFYKMCPDESKDRYQKHVKAAIANAEAIMVIQVQLIRKEIANTGFKERSEVNVYALQCMRELRKTLKYFNGGIVEKVITKIDHVNVILSDTITTIRNMTG